MVKNLQNAEWQSKGKYTKQTKTLWYLATLYFRIKTASLEKYSNEDVSFLMNEMSKAGYSKLNKNSVKAYIGALNGTIVRDALKNNKSYQKEVNEFRKKMNLPIINFN